jgi:hypothetical protein
MPSRMTPLDEQHRSGASRSTMITSVTEGTPRRRASGEDRPGALRVSPCSAAARGYTSGLAARRAWRSRWRRCYLVAAKDATAATALRRNDLHAVGPGRYHERGGPAGKHRYARRVVDGRRAIDKGASGMDRCVGMPERDNEQGHQQEIPTPARENTERVV